MCGRQTLLTGTRDTKNEQKQIPVNTVHRPRLHKNTRVYLNRVIVRDGQFALWSTADPQEGKILDKFTAQGAAAHHKDLEVSCDKYNSTQATQSK